MMSIVSSLVALALWAHQSSAFSSRPLCHINRKPTTHLGVGDYYGELGGEFMVKDFHSMDQLQDVVRLTSQPLPDRPDGIVCVVKFSSQTEPEARATEAEFDRMARDNPATLHLRSFEEFEDADMLFRQADVTVLPTFDVFYGGNRVGRVEGPNHVEVEELVDRYQFLNSQLDLFSEDSRRPWGDDMGEREFAATPRTTNRFVPGYDWNSNKGFFDEAADRAESDFENQYGDWLPNMED